MLMAVAEACLIGEPICTAVLVLKAEAWFSHLHYLHLNSLNLTSHLPVGQSDPDFPTEATRNGFPQESWDQRLKPHDVTTPAACF